MLLTLLISSFENSRDTIISLIAHLFYSKSPLSAVFSLSHFTWSFCVALQLHPIELTKITSFQAVTFAQYFPSCTIQQIVAARLNRPKEENIRKLFRFIRRKFRACVCECVTIRQWIERIDLWLDKEERLCVKRCISTIWQHFTWNARAHISYRVYSVFTSAFGCLFVWVYVGSVRYKASEKQERVAIPLYALNQFHFALNGCDWNTMLTWSEMEWMKIIVYIDPILLSHNNLIKNNYINNYSNGN